MSIITFPLNNTDYNADDMALYFSNRTTGVFSADGELTTTSNNSMSVVISPGRAWIKFDIFRGYIIANKNTTILNIPIADGVLNRIDRVVLKYDVVANESSIYIKRGTPNTNPVPPSLIRNVNVAYELSIAQISVKKGVTIITPSDITDERLDTNVCGIVSDGINHIPTDVLNNQFQDWFENLQTQLDENQATNLQNQINNLRSDTDTWLDFKANGGQIDNTIINTRSFEIKDFGYFSRNTYTGNTELVQVNKGKKLVLMTKDNNNQLLELAFNGENGAFEPNPTTSLTLGSSAKSFQDIFLGKPQVNTNGFAKLTNGLIMQWGVGSGQFNNTQKIISGITYPLKFPNASLLGMSNIYANSFGWDVADLNSVVYNMAPTGLSINCVPVIKTNLTGTVYYYWFAIGY